MHSYVLSKLVKVYQETDNPQYLFCISQDFQTHLAPMIQLKYINLLLFLAREHNNLLRNMTLEFNIFIKTYIGSKGCKT